MTHEHGEGDPWVPATPATGEPWGPASQGVPLPPEEPPPGAADATTYIPPVPGAMDATTYIPPVPGHGSGGGARSGDTQFLPPVPAAAGPDPVPGEFENLFRQEAEPPRNPRARAARAEREERRRRTSQYAVMGAVIVGCAVLGLGLSAAIYGGGEDDKPAESPVAADSAATPARTPDPAPSAEESAKESPKASEAPDDEENGPGRPQAEALDLLLADSSSSRDAVVRSVANIRTCSNLDQAAADLRAAADQRRTLVARLQGLAVDQLPRNAQLTAALVKAWNASAAADDL
ncbi:hypothetical protein [Streptomyces sp. NPDC058953]|uniref:hypothetical protein n=1 Tax=Streptomyces sp. NPDC058953 TaxID=3346676 RepID=UPI0036AD243A